jgi:hypothetical protein
MTVRYSHLTAEHLRSAGEMMGRPSKDAPTEAVSVGNVSPLCAPLCAAEETA